MCKFLSTLPLLHYIKLHYITLHYIKLHYITLHAYTFQRSNVCPKATECEKRNTKSSWYGSYISTRISSNFVLQSMCVLFTDLYIIVTIEVANYA